MSANGTPADMAVIDEVTTLCRRLRLKYVREQLADVVADALDQEHSFEEIAGQLAINPATARRRYAAYAKRRTPLAID